MRYENIIAIKWNDNANLYTSKIKTIKLSFYLGDSWSMNSKNKKLIDWNEKRSLNLKTFIEYMDKEISQNKFFILPRIKNNCIMFLAEIATCLLVPFKNRYKDKIEDHIESIIDVLISHGFALFESSLYQLLISEGLENKSDQYLCGFLKYFKQNTGTLDSQEMLGYEHAVKIKGNIDNERSWSELSQIVETYKKNYKLFNDKLKEYDLWKQESTNLIKDNIKTNNSKVASNIQDLKHQKSKLMLSGPLKMWHDRLSVYEDGIYIKREDEDFKFVHISSKKLNKLTSQEIIKEYNVDKDFQKGQIDRKIQIGKIRIDFYRMVAWAIFGIILSSVAIATPIIFSNELWQDSKKLFIFISTASSFFVFIYGYILRIFVKNLISSRHIAEEINERISLTQFYLSLIQQKVPSGQINFALSEIFKRINTGLIKEEGANNLVTEIAKTIRGK